MSLADRIALGSSRLPPEWQAKVLEFIELILHGADEARLNDFRTMVAASLDDAGDPVSEGLSVGRWTRT